MQHQMTIQYETVKYYSGAIGSRSPAGSDQPTDSDVNVKGFADPSRYDTQRSPLARPGSTASVLGQGGLLDTGLGIISDLQRGGTAGILGAVQKAGTAYGTFKGADIGGIIREEATGSAKDIIRAGAPGATRAIINKSDSVFFPTPPKR
jgi:hypothetical protein